MRELLVRIEHVAGFRIGHVHRGVEPFQHRRETLVGVAERQAKPADDEREQHEHRELDGAVPDIQLRLGVEPVHVDDRDVPRMSEMMDITSAALKLSDQAATKIGAR